MMARVGATSLIEQFEKQVVQHPSCIALTIEDGRTYSYHELNLLSDTIAKYVAYKMDQAKEDNGGGEERLVTIMMDRDVGIVASILGILKAGAAYVPVDPAFPPDRQSYIFKHSRCHLALLSDECMEKARELGVDLPATVVIDSKSGVVSAKQPGGRFPDDIVYSSSIGISLREKRAQAQARSMGGLAYVLYTSGSTGLPKGVMVMQQGVINIINWFAYQLGMAPGKKVLGLTTFCFDISVLEMFMPLLHGANLVLAYSSTQKDPFRLLEIIEDNRIDVLQATPTTFEMMLATGWKGDSLLDLLVGGEAFRPTLLPMVAQSRSVRNVYGPTETTIWSSSYTLPKDIVNTTHAGASPPPISIGAPISETDFYLASEADVSKLSLPDDEGELCIGGMGVARGYLHAEDLTRGKFLPCPFSGGNGGIMYRTGDIVKKLPGSDCYVFVRRMDDQVKIDGFRIELAEIEQVYMQHELVNQAVALVRNGRIAIYLKAAPGKSILGAKEQHEVEEAARRKLTYYMVPKDVVIVDQFPHTANGKLDRKALPDPPPLHEQLVDTIPVLNISEFPGVVGNLEVGMSQTKTIVDHVCNVFEIVRGKRPNPNASFAAMGIDSLGAVLFIRCLSDSVGGVKIKPSDVYSPGVTIRSFASILHQRLAQENEQALLNLGISLELDTRVDALNAGDANDDTTLADAATAEFEELISSNKGLFEGLRGIFAFMVLYDHFHNQQTSGGYSLAISSDVNLFVILSGFTTALHLRDVVPRYTDLPMLKKRAAFNWKNFLLTRAIGIFPILWFAILLCAPRWVFQTQGGMEYMVQERRRLPVTEELSGGCAILYVIGMQLWDVRCRRVGPDDLAYACIIWNCFIMYSLLRYLLRQAQTYYLRPQITCCSIQLRDARLVVNLAQDKKIDHDRVILLEEGRAKTPSQIVSPIPRLIDLVVYNRLPTKYALILAALWFVLFFGLFNVLWLRSTQAKNPITFISYFIAGVVVASVWENGHWCRSNQAGDSGTICKCLWMHKFQPLVDRFGADAILILCAFLCAPLPEMQSGDATSFGNFLKWAGIPILVVVFLPLVCGQKLGMERRNLSRFILENPFAQTLGYTSYTLCKGAVCRFLLLHTDVS